MDFYYLAGVGLLVVQTGLLVYLVAVLLDPEKFS